MNINKQEILENICYTELVYGRINKKLNINLSKKQIEVYMSLLKNSNWSTSPFNVLAYKQVSINKKG